MYLNNQNLGYGLHVLVDRETKAVHMNLDLQLWKTKDANEKLMILSEQDEVTILLLTGKIIVANKNKVQIGERDSLFDQVGYCYAFGCNQTIEIQSCKESEVLIIKTANNKLKGKHTFDPNNVVEEFFGKDQWDNTALRLVRTYYDYTNLSDSNLVVGEVISYPGCWSSYLPHYHDQPEIYFFKFDKPQGFGISVAGNNAYIVQENDVNAIESNVVHPVVSAPGYPLYFCWIIRHLDHKPWKKDRKVVSEHAWLEQPNVTYWNKKKK